MMNRKQRRVEASKARKADAKHQDVGSDPQLVKAQLIQDELHTAVTKALGGKEATDEDIALVINCLGMTAAGLACRIGVGESEFVDKMSIYIKQVRQALGMKDDELPGPGLVLP